MSFLTSTIKSALRVGNSGASRAASRATCELLVSSAIGVGAIDNGLLTAPMVKALSRTTFTILLPMFHCTSIIETITTYGLDRSSLSVPVLAAVQSFLLYVLTTRLSLPLLGIDGDSDDGRGTIICSTFGNSGVLPIIFCESLFRDASAKNDHLAQSMAFISLFLVGWSPFFWSFGQSILLGRGASSSSSSGSETVVESRRERALAAARAALPPPVMGVLTGMVVATIPPLRRLFISDDRHSAPLAVVYNTMLNFGRAASPLALLVLVCSLALGAGFGGDGEDAVVPAGAGAKSEDAEEEGDVPHLLRWSVVSLTRFIVSPALMFGLLRTASKLGMIGGPEDFPMLWFVCMLEAAMPPAQMQVVMLQVVDKMKEAGEMATFLFSVYATAMVPVVIILSIALDHFGLA